MANCKECGNLLKFLHEIKEGGGLCHNCGPGSAKQQAADGVAPAPQNARAGVQKTRADVIISHPGGGIEEFDIDKQPGKGAELVSPQVQTQNIVTIPSNDSQPGTHAPSEAQLDFVESVGGTNFSEFTDDVAGELQKLRRENANLKLEFSRIRNSTPVDETQDLTPTNKKSKRGKADAKRSKNNSKRGTKASGKKSSNRKR